MATTYLLYGWELSLYSGKARAYLRWKQVPFRERAVNFLDMKKIRKQVGATVMPVLVTPEGEWLQDTSHIIDRLEARFPAQPVMPATPRQRVAAMLLEAWGDEFWLPPAMHYRWNFGENFEQVFQPEGGRNLMPFAPRLIRNRMIGVAARQMQSFLPGLGVTPEQTRVIEAWTEAMCDVLEMHFAAHDYLLGSRPCYGDFGLIGPLYAHLGRDPYPKRVLMEPRPHLRAWIERMQHPPVPLGGTYLPDDEIPATLTPLFDSVFQEFLPYLQATLERMQQPGNQPAPGRGYARNLGEVRVPLQQGPLRLQTRPFAVWMIQRALDTYHALDAAGQSAVRDWLSELGGPPLTELDIPRLRRIALHVAPG